MNRKKVLELAKAAGYSGIADLTKIKAHLRDSGFDPDTFEDADGKVHKIDEAWTKTVVIRATAGEELDVGRTEAPDGGEAPETGEDPEGASFNGEASGKSGVVAIPRARLKALEEAERLHKTTGKIIQAPSIRSSRERAVKAYNQKAATEGRASGDTGPRHGTAFVDGERAELFGAVTRLKFASMYPGQLGDYAQKSADVEVVKALGTTSNALGAALIPDEFKADLIELKERFSVMRGVIGVTQMSRDTLTLPRLGSDVAGAWLVENAAITAENKPTFDNVSLSVKKFGALVQVSNELMHDSALNVGDIVARSMARCAGNAEDDAAINGDGTSTYGGIRGLVNKLDSNAYYTTTNTTWATITWGDLLNARAKLADIPGLGEPSFLCSAQFFYGVVHPLIHAAGGQTMSERIAGFTAVQAGGYQFILSPKCPQSLPASKIACFVGWFGAGAKFGESGMPEVVSSDQRYFEYDQIAFRMIQRVDINIHELGASGSNIIIGGLKTT